jgi:MerR family copper efflux transcriptional regulator
MGVLSIGRLAKATSVSADTIRFYEKCGLLVPQRRPSGFREYSADALERLRFIRRARELGLSLKEISQLLALESQDNGSELKDLIATQLRTIDQKIVELRAWRSALLQWQDQPGEEAAAPRSITHFITSFTSSGTEPCVSDCACTDPRTC